MTEQSLTDMIREQADDNEQLLSDPKATRAMLRDGLAATSALMITASVVIEAGAAQPLQLLTNRPERELTAAEAAEFEDLRGRFAEAVEHGGVTVLDLKADDTPIGAVILEASVRSAMDTIKRVGYFAARDELDQAEQLVVRLGLPV